MPGFSYNLIVDNSGFKCFIFDGIKVRFPP
jgi:hypothetical protein